MTTIPARQLAREYSQILQRVKEGETVGVVVNDQVIAVLYPPDEFEIEKKEKVVKVTCELNYVNNLLSCNNVGKHEFVIPPDWQQLGKREVMLCDEHFATISQSR